MATLTAEVVSSSDMVVLVLDHEGHARDEWGPRLRALGVPAERVRIVQPRSELRMGLVELADSGLLEDMVRRWDIGLLVLDSMTPAMVGESRSEYDPETPWLVSEIQQATGIPWLISAHVPKGGGEGPFGSVSQLGMMRAGYSISEVDGDKVLTLVKANDRPTPETWYLDIVWTREGVLEGVEHRRAWVDPGPPVPARGLQQDALRHLFADREELTLADVVRHLEVSPKVARDRLTMVGAVNIAAKGRPGRYALASYRPSP